LETVIRDILAGDKEKFRVIIQEYSADLMRLAYHFVRDWDEAQDITQATFIACYNALSRYDPARPFRPWLYRIHVNQCRSAHRRRMRHLARFIRLEEAPPLVAEPPPSETGEMIMRLVQRLSPKQRTAFILIEVESLTSLEAAEIMGCSDSTARVHLVRAKEHLRRMLSAAGVEL
jgi:RNA polymerase sigma-70 factor (ECF subfamily)